MSNSKRVTLDGADLSVLRKYPEVLKGWGYRVHPASRRLLNAVSGNIGIEPGANPLLTHTGSEKLDESVKILHELDCGGRLLKLNTIELGDIKIDPSWFCDNCKKVFYPGEEIYAGQTN